MSVRVLVVDDSATMRELISAVLRRDPEIEVVGHAADPLEARTAIKQLNPDVITLDVEMPNMNGLDFLEKIMRLRPTPVIMVSTLTQAGAAATLRALECGAIDCVAKPSNGDYHDFDQLPEKVRAAAKSRLQPRCLAQGEPVKRERAERFASDGRIVAIGSSTGGVEALIAVLSRFPANCPPVLIAQHMPATFTRSFAERLNRLCAPEVAEAEDGMPVLSGHVYLAPGSAHLEIVHPGKPRCRLHEGERVSGHRPSVDVLFGSVARVAGARSLGVILTGMGRDGAQGLLDMRRAGAETIGQDEASCIVYGMPKVAFEIGAVARQLPLGKLADHILRRTNLHNRERV
ncbi:chemotaxis response regulator protein-glutamate methylesterase [Acidiphilium acidophilum]|uniref:protein-glutamate methylesterase/protein-glutamine glutaminase n=1 Tax=Acidiphilium acidophilum TaxID=76588 RepID=UPI002E8E725A|nr:chemotaxis response regulator protein-glutamate methylesterase [Acidiphilium acidophilum]